MKCPRFLYTLFVCLFLVSPIFILAQRQIPLPYTCSTTCSSVTTKPQTTVGEAKSCKCDHLQQKLDNVTEESQKLKQRVQALENMVTGNPSSCEEYEKFQIILGRENSSSHEVPIYPLKGKLDMTKVIANCTTGWTAFQRRGDGSVDFYRGWEEYAAGFGDEEREFWMGLRKLHKITSEKTYKLRIEMWDWDENYRYAEYSHFEIGDEESKFELSVSGYSGDAGDGMRLHDGMRFLTHDREGGFRKCSKRYTGAWWYIPLYCFTAHLNGKFFPTSETPDGNGIMWNDWLGDHYSLAYVEMQMRPA